MNVYFSKYHDVLIYVLLGYYISFSVHFVKVKNASMLNLVAIANIYSVWKK